MEGHPRATQTIRHLQKSTQYGMVWTVSNAADRSRRTSAATSTLSTASRMSENTRRAAVSVEWPGLKPDWSDGSRSADCRKSVSCLVTSRSRSFDMTGRFEIGRHELAPAASRPGFLRTGVTNGNQRIMPDSQ